MDLGGNGFAITITDTATGTYAFTGLPDGTYTITPTASGFTFTPTHGSWLNLIEGFFSKLARSVLRHIRVASKQELKDRIIAAMDYFNQQPIVHTWSFKLDKAA